MQTSDRVMATVRLVVLSATMFCAGTDAQAPSSPTAGSQSAAAAFSEEVIAEITQGSELKSSLIGGSHIAWWKNAMASRG